MPLTQLLQSLTGTCRHCSQKAALLQRTHPQCRQTHQAGFQEMTKLAAQAAAAHTFNEAALQQTLSAIAQRSRATGEDIERALEEGFRQGVTQAMSDGILTRQEEERLRTFGDSLALEDSAGDSSTPSSSQRTTAGTVPRPGSPQPESRHGNPSSANLKRRLPFPKPDSRNAFPSLPRRRSKPSGRNFWIITG